ncbi:MAG: methyltransferase domain-containing protein, partial [Acidobacteria bacterium]
MRKLYVCPFVQDCHGRLLRLRPGHSLRERWLCLRSTERTAPTRGFGWFWLYVERVNSSRKSRVEARLEASTEASQVVELREHRVAHSGAFVVVEFLLEHVEDPARAVRELHRVTSPGGRVLASTHGVQVYHPSPTDYWRWTHAGLERLFRQNADW